MYVVVKQLDSVESVRNESVEQIFLNECISNAGHSLYTWQMEVHVHGESDA
jgi:hypothetical protein